jgi:hypothetical protein
MCACAAPLYFNVTWSSCVRRGRVSPNKEMVFGNPARGMGRGSEPLAARILLAVSARE